MKAFRFSYPASFFMSIEAPSKEEAIAILFKAINDACGEEYAGYQVDIEPGDNEYDPGSIFWFATSAGKYELDPEKVVVEDEWEAKSG